MENPNTLYTLSYRTTAKVATFLEMKTGPSRTQSPPPKTMLGVLSKPSDYGVYGDDSVFFVLFCIPCKIESAANFPVSAVSEIVSAAHEYRLISTFEFHWKDCHIESVPYQPQTISATTTSATRKDHIGQKE